ncbi:hypothetical protein BpHYR1_027028 [Brachionus plicatilis]|uniref:Uncharacterized protein n=1 Tax=Brachionus plicatilis TaxID=10195 RepID=A0A3M7QWA1_BRAPC|nr:hypothetical protein BpHYR1_027028 [Brachionus plicatilis]
MIQSRIDFLVVRLVDDKEGFESRYIEYPNPFIFNLNLKISNVRQKIYAKSGKYPIFDLMMKIINIFENGRLVINCFEYFYF